MTASIWDIMIGGIRGSKVKHGRRRELVRGDVLCVEDNMLKRYGIWTGDRMVFYGRNQHGVKIVHEASLIDFLQGAEELAICEFPKKYGRPTEWIQPSVIASVVMPQDKIWRMIWRAWKEKKYKLYSPEETACRAESRLGTDGYGTSEHFAVWCKTGIAESHELEAMREFWERIIVY